MGTFFRQADKLPHSETVKKSCRCIETMTSGTSHRTHLYTIVCPMLSRCRQYVFS